MDRIPPWATNGSSLSIPSAARLGACTSSSGACWLPGEKSDPGSGSGSACHSPSLQLDDESMGGAMKPGGRVVCASRSIAPRSTAPCARLLGSATRGTAVDLHLKPCRTRWLHIRTMKGEASSESWEFSWFVFPRARARKERQRRIVGGIMLHDDIFLGGGGVDPRTPFHVRCALARLPVTSEPSWWEAHAGTAVHNGHSTYDPDAQYWDPTDRTGISDLRVLLAYYLCRGRL